MSMNDPLGDMLTRIRNASMRGKSTVRTPASKIRRWVLDVLQSEGYIRGYEEVTSKDGHPEIEIALKYYDGQPVIRELRRVSTPGRRVYSGVKDMPQVRQRPRRRHRLDAARRHVGRSRPAPPTSAAKCSARCSEEGRDVSYRKTARRPLPKGVDATVSGQTSRSRAPRACAASPRPTT
jgi:small subunit ribosomal protein S8